MSARDTSLLPPGLRQDASLRALETLAARPAALDLQAAVLYDFARVPASALIHLAEQLNMLGDAGWDLADTDAKKRALLREAIALHRIKGTPYAVKRALELLGVRASVTEWFQSQPRGRAHTFSVDALVTGQPAGAPAIDARRSEQIRRVVSFWKPASRHFTLRLGLGMQTRLRAAVVFSSQQQLSTQGQLTGVELSGQTPLRAASVLRLVQSTPTAGALIALAPLNTLALQDASLFTPTQVLTASGPLQ
ncbi:tail-related protein [Herbaspirillum seropedicae SmR1]|uniref:Tail-related protein n=1 Tax=Herbaspirillum seropedicae (strain SmR1) TaxID=757424 RepID=D8IV10_HERSS|nr:phage tail protein I [Herbaspirillum seropedicae]ADJ61729.1 tail-related protein [Herbaspirillum seropedicae SmR1]